MPRPYQSLKIIELEKLVSENAGNFSILRPVFEELSHRTSERSKLLKAVVKDQLDNKADPMDQDVFAIDFGPPGVPTTSRSPGAAARVEPISDTMSNSGQSAGGELPFTPASLEDDNAPPAVARARQVFRFLRDFAERSVPVRRQLTEHLWFLRLSSLPSHAAITIGKVTSANALDGDDAATPSSEPLLKVRRPTLSNAPEVPANFAEWVTCDVEDPFVTPKLQEERDRRNNSREADGEVSLVSERRADDPVREQALQAWLAAWNSWATSEQPARKAMRVFEDLYELLGRIERESERVELLLGDGRVRRFLSSDRVDHPVLLQRVELQFDPGRLEFRLFDADKAPELYGPALQGEDGIGGERLHALQHELEQAGFHPLASDGTSGFLARVAGLLGPNARYLEKETTAGSNQTPTVQRDPVLFLRLRSSGIPAAMTRVLEDIKNSTKVPRAIEQVVGIDSTTNVDVSVEEGINNLSPGESLIADMEVLAAAGESPDVLFAKLANAEQIAIARTLEKHGAVLVQGPPGTGKSHTIANLIGHLVAHGNRVLVTSHTTKALRVLRQHVPADLRPLCVALLDQDLQGRAQLEEAVRGIVERVSSSSEHELKKEVSHMRETRQRLLARASHLNEQLRIARAGEYEPIILAGESVAPARAAAIAREQEAQHHWMPAELEAGAPIPLSSEELLRLYKSNEHLSYEEEMELRGSLPNRSDVMSGEQFSELVTSLNATETANEASMWMRPPQEGDAVAISELDRGLCQFLAEYEDLVDWQRALVAAGWAGGEERIIWVELGEQARRNHALHAKNLRLLLDYQVEACGAATPETHQVIPEICEHLSASGFLGRWQLIFRPKWKQALQSWRVNSHAPKSYNEFAAIAATLELEESRAKFKHRWDRLASTVGLPSIADLPNPVEPVVLQYVEQFPLLLDWWAKSWQPILDAMLHAGFNWERCRASEVARRGPVSPFQLLVQVSRDVLPDLVRNRLSVTRRIFASRMLDEQKGRLANHSGSIVAVLRTALAERDCEAWALARVAFEEVADKYETWVEREALLARLAKSAPAWSDCIRHREGIHGRPSVPAATTDAWRWRQLVQELERRASIDEREVASSLERCRAELRDATRELIDRMAWLRQLQRTDGNARRALVGWSDTQKKIGKGTGKRVPELQARARELLSQARDAVPVWIMPLARVAENFDPSARKFDVVIVDEASQSDITGLLAFYMGKRVVVVGDHEQVSPAAVGQRVDSVQHLISQHLIGIPNRHLYDGQTSIYDLARQAFGGNLALKEHFRCVPDIIEFSNQLAYDGQMRPLRDPATAMQPQLAEYVVPVEMWMGADGKTNLGEARVAAALLAAMDAMPEYDGKSFGVISLVGEEQAMLVQNLFLSVLGAERLQARNFAAGNPAQFQGDERDLIVLTMVDRPSPDRRPLALRDVALFKQRYNVAVSRARDHVWLVHSLDPNRDLQLTDLRRRLIDHVRDPGAIRRAQATAVRRAESPFEQAVIERLVSAGYQVIAQVVVGRYRIDMVVADGQHRVAVECDGDRFHPPEQIPEDIARQAVLERAGWRFIRIRGTRFFRKPDETMEWVIAELGRLGVRPIGIGEAAEVAAQPGADHRDAVVRNAWRIMRERGWLPAPAFSDAITES